MRAPPHGRAHPNSPHPYARETGILGEVLAEERARNHATVNRSFTAQYPQATLKGLSMRNFW